MPTENMSEFLEILKIMFSEKNDRISMIVNLIPGTSRINKSSSTHSVQINYISYLIYFVAELVIIVLFNVFSFVELNKRRL